MDDESGSDRQDQATAGDAVSATPGAQRHQKFWRRMWSRAKLVLGRLKPGPRSWRGAAIGVLATASLIYLVLALWTVVLARENLVTYIIA